MKRIIPILAILFIAACSSDDNVSKTNYELSGLRSVHSDTENENGKYDNFVSVSVSNLTTKEVNGYVLFHLKDYEPVKTDSHYVLSHNKSQFVFSTNFETEEIIDKTYIIKAEFVRE